MKITTIGIDLAKSVIQLGVYPSRNTASTMHFIYRVLEEMPFPIQRIQTNRGTEFFADSVQHSARHHYALNSLQLKLTAGTLNGNDLAGINR